MGLNALFRWLAAGLAMVVLALVVHAALHERHVLKQAEDGLQALQRLRRVLSAGEMLSRERAPSFAVLRDVGHESPLRAREELMAARLDTDRAFAAATADLAALGEEDPSYRRVVTAVDRARLLLDEVRLSVDSEVSRQDSSRSAHVARDIARLREAHALLEPAVADLAGRAQRAYPDLTPPLQGAVLAARLREVGGLLAAGLRPAVVRGTPFTPEEDDATHLQLGRLDQLRELLDSYLDGYRGTDAVASARQQLRHGLFGRGAALIDQIVEAGHHGGPYPVDALRFGELIVPDLARAFDLRNALLDDAERQALARRNAARLDLQVMATLSLVALSALALGLWLVHRRVVVPLSQTARVIHGLAEGRHDLTVPEARADDEIGAVLGAVRAMQKVQILQQTMEEERAQLITQLSQLSNTDGLTGLLNRRAFFEQAERELATAQRHGFHLSVVLLDVDHFKAINDSYGHGVGDEALRAVASTLAAQIRTGDLAARYGGEEFVLLLGHCDAAQAFKSAERLREAVSQLRVADPLGGAFALTASLGVASTGQHGLELQHLLSVADAAMYRAKRTGRNRVAGAEPAPAPPPAPMSPPVAPAALPGPPPSAGGGRLPEELGAKG
ncbi:GGDEF domain-containing protein [Ideonella livida]|uniref:diguanylate cyclase n=1 Tax=Ideonella livida TaxID=2707176 RepID=A0A7C9TJC2_9BURK|nr:diguanylate cyclase [Ideonella livida]NDY91062.1 diguanylate cyclase [Ideonella livida]